jgi:hypothetical protein
MTEVRGLHKIALRLGRSTKTTRHWIALGYLRVRRVGPFRNSALEAPAADIDRLREQYGPKKEDE